jgi:hypothetical protein
VKVPPSYCNIQRQSPAGICPENVVLTPHVLKIRLWDMYNKAFQLVWMPEIADIL